MWFQRFIVDTFRRRSVERLRGVLWKLFFVVALFLNNSLLLAYPTLSGISSTMRYVDRRRMARGYPFIIDNAD